MKLQVSNYIGTDDATLEFDKIALVAGINAAGKSSIARAMTSLLTGNPLPLTELRKTDAGMLIRTGAAPSQISLSDGEDETVITYPKAEVMTKGEPMSSTPVACGVVNVARMNPKDRATYLGELLGTSPTKEAVIDAVVAIGVAETHAEQLWENINQLGWDGSHANAKETGAKMKGQWLEVTGEQYGSNKAETWLPPTWGTDLAGASLESLEAHVVEAREFSESAVAVDAIDTDRRDVLQKEADHLSVRREALEMANLSADSVTDKINLAVERQSKLKKPSEEQTTVACPHCEKLVVVHDGQIEKPVKINAKDNKSRADAIKAAAEEIANLNKTYTDLSTAVRKHQANLTISEDADTELAAMIESKNEGASAEQIEAARNAVIVAEQARDAFKAKTRADQLHVSVQKNQLIVNLLAADGLRKIALDSALSSFNDDLGTWCHRASYPVVSVADDLSIRYDGRPHLLCSVSEQFRTQVIFQATCANLDGSDAIVIDGADVLDRAGRNGLFKMLALLEFPALVCMTIMKQEDMPDLAKADMGASFWIEGGKIV